MNALCLLVCAGILVSTAHADCADGLPYRRIACVNATHFERTDSSGNICDVSACRFGWACEGTSCVSPDGIAGHILRGADFQIVESVPVSQFSQCTASQSADVASGLMLCDVWHSTRAAQPTFAHILGNTWVHFGFGPNASAPACSASPAAWRACFAANVAAQLRAFQAESPELLASGGLMEFLDQANLDDPGDFPAAVCVPGSVGQWGGNTTCVPDVTAAAGQAYYIAWGQAFIDAGIRAIFFGQARLTGGSAADGSDGVTPAGAAGFLAVIDALRAYGSTRGAGRLYFGPQAAASLTLSNGTDVADWVYGAQHLENHTAAPFLTQPLLRNGSYVTTQYGSGDFHDANRVNAGTSGGGGGAGRLLPTVLDYDNFSGDPDVYDDIRRLAAWPDAGRPRLFTDHYRWLRAYNPSAAVTLPFSKVLAVPQQCRCYANTSLPIWGAGPIYFSASACGLLDAARTVWADPWVSPVDGGVSTPHLGQQLQGAGDMAVFVFAEVLGRNFSSAAEYEDAVLALPPRVFGAAGARCGFVTSVLGSPEFAARVCPASLGSLPQAQCTVRAVYPAILLVSAPDSFVATVAPELASGALTPAQLAASLCDSADAAGLYNQTSPTV